MIKPKPPKVVALVAATLTVNVASVPDVLVIFFEPPTAMTARPPTV